MKFLIAIPDHEYYIWQMLVQINNFRKLGYEQDTIYVFGIRDGKPSDLLMKFINSKDLKCKFYIIHDTRDKKNYTSSMRPYILSKFYQLYGFREKVICYLDPDVIFTKKLDFSKFTNDDTWYVSDTRGYIGVAYIKSKSTQLFREMCTIVGIDPKIVEDNDENAGGAQYIMKNIDHKFWDKVYEDSEALYGYMNLTSGQYNPQHPIQAWTADMWAVLWNGWLFGNEIKIDKDLDFCWASDHISRWEQTYLFHNAGVIVNDGQHFSKTAYQISPFKKEVLGQKTSASFNFIKEIKETEVNFPDLIY